MTDTIQEYYDSILVEHGTGTNNATRLEADYWKAQDSVTIEISNTGFYTAGSELISLSREEASALHAFLGKHLGL